MSQRAEALAKRLEQGARALADYADGLSDAEWSMSIPKDGRSVGVIVHHVASMYPIEVQLAQTLAAAKPIAGVTWDAVAGINANHAHEHKAVGKTETLDLLRRNSKAAADAIRAFSDDAARRGGAGVIECRCPSHRAVFRRGPCRAAQLPSSIADTGDRGSVGGDNSVCERSVQACAYS